VVIPVKIGMITYKVRYFKDGQNEELIRSHLDLIEEKKEKSAMRAAVYQQRMTHFYNKKV